MRFAFMGTPQYAATILEHLLAAGRRPDLVVTQPDRGVGRRRVLTPPPVKSVAEAAGIPVLQPEKITAEVREAIAATKPEVILVAAFGKILRPSLLAVPPRGCVNVHAGLLPRYRGAAPANWTLIDGQTETGVSIMLMDEGIDTGPILAQRHLPIDPTHDAGELLAEMAAAAGPLLVATLDDWMAGRITPSPQPETGVGYARMLTKDDGLLDWSLAADAIHNRVRGLNPWPGALTHWRGNALKILRSRPVDANGAPGEVLVADRELVVGCGRGALALLNLQLAGKKAMDAAALLNGTPVRVGERLGDS